MLTWAASARAFVCTQSADDSGGNTGPALTWHTRNITYTFQTNGSSQLAPLTTFATLQNAFGVWQNLTLDPNDVAQCGSLPGTDIAFTRNSTLSNPNWVGYNYLDPNSNVNLLVFRDSAWNYGADTIDTIALTTATYSQLTGEIIDADIEFNSFANKFSTDALPPMAHYDLLNTAVHEIGHFIGLAHCGAVTCGHNEVMEPTANTMEIVKRQLKCDDRAAAVFKYPKGADNGYCNGANAATCGGCAPPISVTQVPQISLLGQSTGRGGAACSQAALHPAWLSMCWIAWQALRRRRAHRLERPMRKPSRSGCWVGIVALTLASLCGCGSEECDGVPVVPAAGAPLILGMALVEQVSNDPWRIILAADFADTDGDLGGGVVNFYSNHNTEPTLSQSLSRVYGTSGGIDPNAQTGRLGLLLRFPQNTLSDSQLHLGTQLVDAASNRSNCYTIDLGFNLVSSGP